MARRACVSRKSAITHQLCLGGSRTQSSTPSLAVMPQRGGYTSLWFFRLVNYAMALLTAICGTRCNFKYITPDDNILDAHFYCPSCFIYIFLSSKSIMNSSSGNKSTEFPDTQRAFLKSFIPEYEKYIVENNPDHKSHSKDLKDWRVKKARLLMQDTCIQDLVKNSAVEPKEWEKVCTFFSSFFSLSTNL